MAEKAPQTNWQKVQACLDALPPGSPLPTGTIIGERTGLRTRQIGSSFAFLRRTGRLEGSDREDTLRRTSEGMVRFRGGKRDLYQEYADRGWAPTEIHWALVFTRGIDINPKYINNTIVKERRKSALLSEEERVKKRAYRILTKEERDDIKRTVIKGTPDSVEGRVRLWLGLRDWFQILGLEIKQLKRMDWFRIMTIPQAPQVQSLENVSLDNHKDNSPETETSSFQLQFPEDPLTSKGSRVRLNGGKQVGIVEGEVIEGGSTYIRVRLLEGVERVLLLNGKEQQEEVKFGEGIIKYIPKASIHERAELISF